MKDKADEIFDANLAIVIMRTGGLLGDWCTTRKKLIISRVLATFTLLSCFVYASLPFTVFFTEDTDLSMITEIVSMSTVGFHGVFKAVLVLWRGADMAELARRLRRPLPLLPAEVSGGAEQRRAVAEANRRASLLTRALLCVCVSVTLGWDILPYFRSRVTGRVRYQRVTWHFTNVSKFPGYDIEVAINWLGNMSTMTSIAGTDCFVCCVLIYAIMQIKLVHVSIISVKQRARDILQRRDFPSVTQNETRENDAALEDPRVARVSKDLLKECAKQHLEVLKLASVIQDVFSVNLLLQFVSIILLTCFLVFQIVKNLDDVETTSRFAPFCAIVIMDLYMYCSFGEMIRHESEQLSLACYSCDWHGASREFTSALRIIMMRATRPITLHAGGFYNLTLDTFTNIVQVSYSMCMILLNSEED